MTSCWRRARLRLGGGCGAGRWIGVAAAIALLTGCVAQSPQDEDLGRDTEAAPQAVADAAAPDNADDEGTGNGSPSPEPAAEAGDDAGDLEGARGAESADQDAPLGEGVEPAHLRIPEIEVDEQLIDLGIQDNGAMEAPSDWDRAGWFTGGSKPGGQGPTVIAGHVDSRTGPAVFYRLTNLEIGDRVEVTDAHGTVHEYRIYRVDDLPKDDFPTHEVFGAQNSDELRLITCTGEFDHVELAHADNRVVFAEVVEA